MKQTPTRFFTFLLLVFFGLFFAKNNLHAQYVANGSASCSGSCCQLTPDVGGQAGSIFSSASIDLNQPFNLSAVLNFGSKDANGADGIVFIFATTNTALGTGGGGLGYDGITPSIAVEYDDYQNGGFGDPAQDHVAIISNGSVNHTLPSNLVGPVVLPNVEDGLDHCFSVNWDPASNTLTATIDATTVSYSGNIIASIFGGNPNVYYGFSSGTGSLSNIHSVCFGGPTLTPMDDQTVCPGQSAPLQADLNGTSWSWTPNPTLSATNISNPVATPTTTTTYTVNISYACGYSATDNVTVFVAPPPNAVASSNSPLCEGETLLLNASGGVDYAWSGPLFWGSNQQNPSISNVEIANSGTYTVTVTDAAGCTASASTQVVVFPLPIVAIVPVLVPLCTNGPVVNLLAVPSGGVWGGAANAQGQVNPATLPPGIHSVTYTFTNANGCSDTDEIFVEIVAAPNVNITQPGPFCQTDPPTTLTATPPGGIWTGAADPGGVVTPANLPTGIHVVHYTYFDGNGCQGDDEIFIQVFPATPVNIQPAGPFCPTAPVQTLTATPPGGTWGGAANASGQINPAALNTGLNMVTYSYSSANACPGADTIYVLIHCMPYAILSGSATICEGETTQWLCDIGGVDSYGFSCWQGPYIVTVAIDGVPLPPLVITSSPFTFPTNTPGTYTISGISDDNDCTAVGTGSATVTVVGAPTVGNFDLTCDPTQTMYTVSFEISGGDPATYTVTGPVPGNLTVSPPYIFTSDPIPSGSAYSFVVNDVNDCDPTTLSGSFSCQCVTDAGTMSGGLLTACVGDSVTATHNGDEFLDASDNLIFVLHGSNGNSLGTVFGSNGSGQFGLVPPMVPGVTYYISAVAGDSTANDGVDLNDPCLSVSFGQPVLFNPLPQASLGSSVEICNGGQSTLTFTLTGNAPFDVAYSDGSQNFTLNNILNGHTVTVTPTATTTYSLVSTGDNSSPACSVAGGNSVTVTVWQPALTNQSLQICDGDSVLLGGGFQLAPGIFHDTLSTSHGCDSVIVSALMVNGLDTTFFTGTSCNPANVGTVTQFFLNQNGCDSLVVTTTTFSSTDTTLLSSTTCDPVAAGVFSQTYVTPEGCDSIVIETVALLPTDTTYLTDASCNPASVGVFVQNLTNQFGCDSTVFLTVTFSLTDTTLVGSTTCDPLAAGVFTQNYLTPEGCDSVVVATVTLLPTDIVFLTDTSCDPANAGTFIQNLTNQYGCDSTVVLTVTYSPQDTTLLASTTCDPAMAGVFTQIITLPDGCDSTTIETVTLLPSDTTLLFATSCNPQDTGLVAVILANQFGCDSLVLTLTSLTTPADCGVLATLTGSTVPCTETTGPLTLTVTLGQPPFNYSWTGPQSGSGVAAVVNVPQVIGNLPPGTYSVTVTAANGFTTTVTAEILQILPPVIAVQVASDFNGFAVSCAGETDGSAAATASGGAPPYIFSWSNGATAPQANDLAAGTFAVTVTDSNGCTDAGQVSLDEPPALAITFIVSDLDCFGQNDGSIFVQPSGGTPPYAFSLNGGLPQASNAFTGLPSGTFNVTAQDANGCTTAEIIGINAPLPVEVELGDDLTIDLGESASLNAIVNLPFDSLAAIGWSGIDSVECPACLTQPVVPLFTTTYSVSVTADNGCTDEDAVTVFVDRRRHVYVPNAFSPNGDGINDGFMIFAKPNTVRKVRSFLVFSRWGETVFQYFNVPPNDPAFGWDGQHRGEELDPAVFVWFAEVEFIDGKVLLLEGDVSLVR
ncbi:MAG: gliding motility-associated C-terminal domain-containing protein [Bacteroidetes bacterium]|nr:gliding motility-associated C-terminal domain-containing protein [Bacteroidota bacterium]